MSAAPVLELRSGCLTNTTKLDLANIETWMLWPDVDQKRERQRALQAITAAQLTELFPVLDEDFVRAAGPTIRDALPLTYVREGIRKKIVYGRVAGSILRGTLSAIRENPTDASMEIVKQEIAECFPAKERMGLKNIQKVWKSYKRVSHLWAAHLEHAGATKSWAFPCRIDLLRDFAEVADWFRRSGEAARTKQHSEGAILRPNECFRFPDEIGIRVIPLQ
jgi:hypothetical protein